MAALNVEMYSRCTEILQRLGVFFFFLNLFPLFWASNSLFAGGYYKLWFLQLVVTYE